MKFSNIHHTLNIALAIGVVILASMSLSGCKKDGCTDTTAVTYDPDANESNAADCEYPVLSLDITPVVGSETFSIGQEYEINGVATTFSTAQYYLSETAIGDDDGMDMPGTYLLVKPGQTTYEVGQITAGHKHMFQFGVGVDTTHNFLDPTTYEAGHPLAPQSPGMHWSWNSGYIFLRLEGQVDTDADGTPDTNFELHIGGKNQYTPLAFDVHLDADAVDTRVAITADFAKFFDGIDLTTDNVTHTMDNMPLAMAIVNNLPKVFSVEE